MLADPLVVNSNWTTITAVGGESFSMPAVERAADHSTYQLVDSGGAGDIPFTMFIGHQYGKRNRYTARLTVAGLAPNLLFDGQSSRFSQSCYVVFDVPPAGIQEPYSSPTYATSKTMMRMIGSLLVSVGAADPVFTRILAGET